jgi:hypothetical protein
MAQPETVQRRDAKMHALSVHASHGTQLLRRQRASMSDAEHDVSSRRPSCVTVCMSGGRSSRLPRRKTPAGFLDDAWRKGKARKAMHHAPPKVLAVRSRRDDR